jgi:hypothetical protein
MDLRDNVAHDAFTVAWRRTGALHRRNQTANGIFLFSKHLWHGFIGLACR